MKTVIIVQARMTSTRLPGKVLKEVMGKPLLEYQIERLKRSEMADEIIIATTVNDTDLPIVRLCERLNIAYFRGSEEDVLSRYYYAAKQYSGDVIARVTSDCPVIDPKIMDNVIKYFIDNQDWCDYASTGDDSYPRGMNTEVFSFNGLEQAFANATKPYEREHVTPYFYLNPDKSTIRYVPYKEDYSQHRWTVDTPEDFELIKRILEALYPQKKEFTLEDCLDLLQRNPEWSLINKHIEQKKLSD
jgi:spore coat polysaccharide biosynthesis protein SpsF